MIIMRLLCDDCGKREPEIESQVNTRKDVPALFDLVLSESDGWIRFRVTARNETQDLCPKCARRRGINPKPKGGVKP